jgi:hypothetical protein
VWARLFDTSQLTLATTKVVESFFFCDHQSTKVVVECARLGAVVVTSKGTVRWAQPADFFLAALVAHFKKEKGQLLFHSFSTMKGSYYPSIDYITDTEGGIHLYTDSQIIFQAPAAPYQTVSQASTPAAPPAYRPCVMGTSWPPLPPGKDNSRFGWRATHRSGFRSQRPEP